MQRLQEVVRAYTAEFDSFTPVFAAEVGKEDVSNTSSSYALLARERGGSEVRFCISRSSYLAILDRMLRAKNLKPCYEYYPELESAILVSVGQNKAHGLLMFLNWEEPEEGTVPMHKIFPKEGDHIMLAYVEKK